MCIIMKLIKTIIEIEMKKTIEVSTTAGKDDDAITEINKKKIVNLIRQSDAIGKN